MLGYDLGFSGHCYSVFYRNIASLSQGHYRHLDFCRGHRKGIFKAGVMIQLIVENL